MSSSWIGSPFCHEAAGKGIEAKAPKMRPRKVKGVEHPHPVTDAAAVASDAAFCCSRYHCYSKTSTKLNVAKLVYFQQLLPTLATVFTTERRKLIGQ